MSVLTIIMALVVGVLAYLLTKTAVGLVKPVVQFAEAAGVIVGCLVALFMLGVIN